MPLPLMIMMCLTGTLYIVFAFVRPPEAISHFFKVPSILVFLPDRLVMPVGRFLVGALVLAGSVYFWLKTH
jgi:hypothetical protein